MQTIMALSEFDSVRWLAVLLDAAAKGLLLLAVAGAVTLLLRRGSAAVRHMVWTLAVIGLLCVPILSIALPQWQVPLLPAWTRAAERTPVPPSVPVVGAHPSGFVPAPAAGLPPAPVKDAPAKAGPMVPPEPSMAAPSQRLDLPALAAPAVASPAPPLYWSTWVLLVWAAGIVLMAAPLLLGTVLASWQTRRARVIVDNGWTTLLADLTAKLGVRRTVSLRRSAGSSIPTTCGILRPTIVLPAEADDWSPERRTVVLLHELAHVKRADCLTQLIARLARAIYWFNPLVWLACRMLRIERERACDDLVLAAGHKPSDYASHLLEIVRTLRSARCPALAAVAMAHRSQFEGRMLAILDPRRNRRALTRLGVLTAVILVAGLVLPLSLIKATAADNSAASAIQPAASQPLSAPATDAPAAKPAGENSANHVVVTGIVVDEKGQGVAGVTVAMPEPPPGFRPAIKPTITGPDGRFALEVGNDDRWCDYLLARLGDARQGYLERIVDGQRLRDVQIALKPAREFPVTVKDDKGHPISGATVAAAAWFRVVSDLYTTDDQGRATLRVAADAPLKYVLALKDNAGLDYFVFWDKEAEHNDPYHLAADYAGPLSFVLNGVTPVTVVVEDEAHEKLTDAFVYPWYIEKPRKGEMFNISGLNLLRHPAPNGRAEFAMLPADNLTPVDFRVQATGYTSAKPWIWDAKSGKKEITATLIKMVHLTGQVLGQDGQPAGGAEVRVWGAGYTMDSFRREVQSNGDGTFTIDVDPEKFYTLSAQKGHDVSPPITQVVHKQPPSEPLVIRLAPGIRVYGQATAGPNNEPAANASTTLIYNDDQSYKDVPPDQQLLPEGNYHRAIGARVVQNGNADKQGNFEFYTFPGKYQLSGFYVRQSTPTQRVTLENADKEVAIHFEKATGAVAMLHGRVVRADKPDVAVSETVLKAQVPQADRPGRLPEGVADRAGNFQISKGTSEMFVYAISPDKKLGTLATIKPSEDNVTIRLSPTASAKGRLLDHNRKPVGGQIIRCYILPDHFNGPWSGIFQVPATTKADGTFILEALIPGLRYVLSSFGLDDIGRSSEPVDLGTLKPESAKTIDLGDKSLPEPNVQPDPQAMRKYLEGNKGLDALAADLTKAIGGQWTVVSDKSVRGYVVFKPDTLVSYDVYPLDWPTFRDGVARTLSATALQEMTVLGANEQYTVTESRDRPSPDPPQSQKIVDFLKLRPTPGLATTQPAR